MNSVDTPVEQSPSEILAAFVQPSARRFRAQGHSDLPGRVEQVGEAHCDVDIGHMTWSSDVEKLPLCMADCTKAHELSHVSFGEKECDKAVAAYKPFAEALKKAHKSQSLADVEAAEKKFAVFKQAALAYHKWFEKTCREDERRAYQAGIDECNKKDVVKSCADLKETSQRDKIMKDWEKFRDNPPNCAAPAAPTKPAPPGQKGPPAKPGPAGPKSPPAGQGPVQKGHEGKSDEPKKDEPGRKSYIAHHRSTFAGQLQRECVGGLAVSGGEEWEGCEPAARMTLQRVSAGAAGPAVAPSTVHEVLRCPGRPLDAPTRGLFESRFAESLPVWRPSRVSSVPIERGLEISAASSTQEREADSLVNRITSRQKPMDRAANAKSATAFDFSGVRVHTDALAAQSAQMVNAHAYTVGNHIVFGARRFDPASQAGQDLLTHELVHVAQQQTEGAGRVQRKPDQPGPVEVGFPEPEECENRADITKEFRDFLKALPGLLKSAPDFTSEQKESFQDMIDRFLEPEGGVNAKTFKVISCDKINSDLLTGAEIALAEVDPTKKEIRLSKSTKQLMDDFKQNKDKTSLLNLIQTLSHEKRHATLGTALQVNPKTVLPGRPETAATKAEYRAQEILAVAEELAVGRVALGKTYAVPISKQEKLRRQNNLIRNYVTEPEYKRLRSIIISKLRDRFGFKNKCDNALTLGVVTSMDHNRWFECVSGAPGGIVPPPPPDLHICEGFCKTQFPRPQTTENEEGADTPESSRNVFP